MRIKIPKVDGRSRRAMYLSVQVVDLDTGKVIGDIENRQGQIRLDSNDEYVRHPSRTISLFGGKYIGQFETHDECYAFAEGVQAVINHLTSLPERRVSEEESDTSAG